MCGFGGFITTDTVVLSHAEAQAKQMALAIQHRGPDDAGVWADVSAGIALGFRRLSILDLSSAGQQPMSSASERFVMTFNGEIYNHTDLRDLLRAEQLSTPAQPWRGHSDSETLLACFEAWGMEETLQKTVGMFAIALWDTQTRTLHLARDRFGEKPLYYGWASSTSTAGSTFVFGSELKALRAYPGFHNSVSREALALYMRFTYVPAPFSIYQNIFKLEPGCMLSIHADTSTNINAALSQAGKLLEAAHVQSVPTAPLAPLRPPAAQGGLRMHRWWSLASVVEAGAQNQISSEEEALETLELRLKEAVRMQSLADVPLGSFLSGGVDSSCIAALMQAQASSPVKTFTVGFEEAEFDESPHARAVAEHLGTEHNEFFVSAKHAQEVIVELPTMYDEPFADSSQIPTHLVCKAARQKVKVALTGDAGDELFGGYNRYLWAPRIWSRLAWLPYPARQALGVVIRAVPTAGWDALSRPVNALLPSSKNFGRAGDRAHKLAAHLGNVHNLDDLFKSLVSEWQDPAQVVKWAGDESGDQAGGLLPEPSSMLSDPWPVAGVEQHQLRMMYRDCTTYLPDDILCKVDRAAMAASLETRAPFLDHRVAELAWQLPLNMKIRNGQGKWALRQVLYKYVPKDLIDRPKAGFAIPIGQWLRGPLKDWAEALLDEKRLELEGYFHPKPIRDKWLQHLTGRFDHSPSLWTVLMFQSWLESTQHKLVTANH
jgi:asparagine synthase (glutamine-hydrolysing)